MLWRTATYTGGTEMFNNKTVGKPEYMSAGRLSLYETSPLFQYMLTIPNYAYPVC